MACRPAGRLPSRVLGNDGRRPSWGNGIPSLIWTSRMPFGRRFREMMANPGRASEMGEKGRSWVMSDFHGGRWRKRMRISFSVPAGGAPLGDGPGSGVDQLPT